jgi:hypothetical protein
MKDGAQPMSSGATDILHQLQGIKKWLVEAAKGPGRVTLHDLQRHGGMLDAVDATRQAHGGIFGGDLATGDIPAGQAVLSSLLASSYKLLAELKAAVAEEEETAEVVRDFTDYLEAARETRPLSLPGGVPHVPDKSEMPA